jgi:hypothetical protein
MARKTQKQQFIEKARELETDENPEAFERVFGKIVPPKHGKARVATPKAKRSKASR